MTAPLAIPTDVRAIVSSALPWPELGVGDIGLPHATIATLGTILFIGLAFLARPRRSTLLWSLMFMGIMAACFGYLAAVAAQSEELRRGSLGVLIGATALLWSGLRAHRGAKPHAWMGPALAVVSIIAFLAAGDSGWYPLVYRGAFVLSSVFALLFLLEWRRMPERNDRLLLPAVAAAIVCAFSGIAVLIGGLFSAPSSTSSLETLRVFNSVGMLVFMVCILVSLVPFSTPGHRATSTGAVRENWERFVATACERLERAEARGEAAWSLLRIELDDAEDIGLAGGLPVFSRLISDIGDRVRAVFPAGADVAIAPEGAVVVLVARPEAATRELIRQTLRLIAVRDPAAPITVTTSASIGWASVATSGYDLDVLLAVTADAAATARDQGGDRWQRVSG